MLDLFSVDVYNDFCSIILGYATKTYTGSITVDGSIAALVLLILGTTRHNINYDWNLKSNPLYGLNIRIGNKTRAQNFSIMENVLRGSSIIGSDSITVNTVFTDNEAAVTRTADLLTNFVGPFAVLYSSSYSCLMNCS